MSEHEPPHASPAKLSLGILIERSPAEVWAALTEPAILVDWLAETATVELAVGGRFALTSAVPFVVGEHTVLTLTPGSVLELSWAMAGQATVVRFELTPDERGTRLGIVHEIPTDPPLALDPEYAAPLVAGELWGYFGGLLKTRLELGRALGRLDPARAPSPTILHVLEIAADPARVFALIDDPSTFHHWNPYTGQASNDRRVGGRYSFGWESEAKGTDGPHEIVEYEPGRKITYRWYGTPPTLVSWTVEPLPGAEHATRLTLTHSGFDIDRNMLIGWNLGWGGFLQQIALYAEKGTAPGWFGM